jgi:hypothetical protein
MTLTVETPLEKRVERLERRAQTRLKIHEADLLRLQPGDIVTLRIYRPLADVEQQAISQAWADTCAAAGIANVPLMILSGADLDLKVIRSDGFSG